MDETDDKYGKIVSFIHSLIIQSYKDKKGLSLIDATCGNGFDTLFLCNVAGITGSVTAFDVQNDAINRTKILLENNLSFKNYKLINASHEFINKYVTNADVCIFNLGYLPFSDKKIKTNGESTVSAINNILPLLNENGRIYIASYLTHDNGEEYNKIMTFLSSMNNYSYNVLHIKLLNKNNNPPEIFIIEKMHDTL